jgi:hypothetical protein
MLGSAFYDRCRDLKAAHCGQQGMAARLGGKTWRQDLAATASIRLLAFALI